MAQTEDTVDSIRRQLERRRRDVYTNMAEMEGELQKIEQALVSLTGQQDLPAPDLTPARERLRRHMQQIAEPRTEPRKKSIGDDKLEAVRDYLRAHPRARQVDIEAGTKLNSGTISVAKAVLADQGEIEIGGKERRSTVWHWKGTR